MALNAQSSNPKWKYHVFLSFRGEDTRFGFTDHLYAALVRKSIITFRDDEELVRGEAISQKLLNAIQESLLAIVIISQNYASSTWCLDELLKILECKHLLGQQVFPIFYGVDPSDVRNQRKGFAEAFRKHEEKYVENTEKVQKWRDALREVANLSGWNSKDEHESKLIEEVVAQVWKKLEFKFPTYNDGLVAIGTRVEELCSRLRLGLEDVGFLGIWGMGGIGKTTLAAALFKRIRSDFDVSCFVANVREISGEGNHGLLQLQNKILSHLNIKGMVIENLSLGRDSLRNLLSNQKVLLVLDDVSSVIQLENLAGKQEWFGRGSRILVTTRDKHLLVSYVALFDMYECKILNKNESLQLFCEKAFKRNEVEKDYLELSKSIVKYAGGLPLALEVLGSFLCERSISDWQDALIKIKQVPHDDIINKLRISYDMLEEEHKTIFLDIACFFKGWYKYKVTEILDSCGLYSTVGINVLIEKSLLTFDGRVIGMHDLLEEMGKAMVFRESPSDPGRRSRLWSFDDIDRVLRNNKGTEKVEGIVLKSSPSKPYEVQWHPKAFSKMCNLRLLIILCDLHLPYGLRCLSSSLKVLVWWGYPLSSLPLGVQLDELVHLQMINSKVKLLWNGTPYFGKLKVIDLSNSKGLRKTPDITGVPFLEALYLNGCRELVAVHQSIGQHKNLQVLSLIECVNLKTFPHRLETCSLKMLFLSNCSKVKKLPEFGENMTSLLVLNLMNCKNLSFLPNSIGNLKYLRILNLSGCSKVSSLPHSINHNRALEDLDLSKTAIGEFHPSLFQLENLKRLSFSRRSDLGNWTLGGFKFRTFRTLKLPPFIFGLSSLTVLDLSYCNLTNDSIPQNLNNLSSLERLILSGNNFTHFPAKYFTNLSKLRCLELEDCRWLQSFPMLPPRARLYESYSAAGKAKYLNLEKLWKLFESSAQELFRSPVSQEFDLPYPEYSEIPPRFDNQKYFPPSTSNVSKLDSVASVTLDIPNDCRSSDWWGVVVFVSLKGEAPKHSQGLHEIVESTHMRLHWSFDTQDPKVGPLSLFSSSTAKLDLYLFTMIVSDDYIYIRRHQRGDHNKLFRHSKHRKPEFTENSTVHFEVQVEGRKIGKFGWHMVRKDDDYEDLQINWFENPLHKEVPEIPSNSKHSNALSKSTMDEFKATANADHGDTFDQQNEEKSRDHLLLGKMFGNIRQGLGLSVLALMSIMVGTRIFLQPKPGLVQNTKTEASTELLQSRLGLRGRVTKVIQPQLPRNHTSNVSQRLSLIHQSPRRFSIL